MLKRLETKVSEEVAKYKVCLLGYVFSLDLLFRLETLVYAQALSFSGEESGRSLGDGGMLGHQMDDPRMLGLRRFPLLPGMVPPKSRYMGLPSIKQEIPLLLDASTTLFVEGFPAFCTRREVSHSFLPFVGFKEVRLVSKESRHSGEDPLVPCFVDFINPAQATTVLDTLQVWYDCKSIGNKEINTTEASSFVPLYAENIATNVFDIPEFCFQRLCSANLCFCLKGFCSRSWGLAEV
ncbi:RNA-binding protein 2-like [Papaver somniferum]|uniref:RNA-binding protein 2-like n=1 Tax=Papaver somniferum TaxID=3469 RepID=UPI000E704D5F|nr:RNA-binding protein 2-like [Papaver somniferum]